MVRDSNFVLDLAVALVPSLDILNGASVTIARRREAVRRFRPTLPSTGDENDDDDGAGVVLLHTYRSERDVTRVEAEDAKAELATISQQLLDTLSTNSMLVEKNRALELRVEEATSQTQKLEMQLATERQTRGQLHRQLDEFERELAELRLARQMPQLIDSPKTKTPSSDEEYELEQAHEAMRLMHLEVQNLRAARAADAAAAADAQAEADSAASEAADRIAELESRLQLAFTEVEDANTVASRELERAEAAENELQYYYVPLTNAQSLELAELRRELNEAPEFPTPPPAAHTLATGPAPPRPDPVRTAPTP